MKTLYISDLDGTLLNNSGIISDNTSEIINKLCDQGLCFSVATARSVLSAVPLLCSLKLTAPIVAMSGVVVYDVKKEKTVKYSPIENESFYKLIKIFESHSKSPFAFFFSSQEERYQIAFRDLKLDIHRVYYETRKKMNGTNIHKVDDYTVPYGYKPVFVSLCDVYADLKEIKEEIDALPSLSCSFYKDTYTEYWFLEVFDASVSKANGLKTVKDYTGADRTVAFGDNRNDFSMFEAADIRCAVSNAVDELKEKADFIIGSNENDGVAHFMMSDYIK